MCVYVYVCLSGDREIQFPSCFKKAEGEWPDRDRLEGSVSGKA